MYLLTPFGNLGQVFMGECICFSKIKDIQDYLGGINDKWNSLSSIPQVYILNAGEKPVLISYEMLKTEIWPYTYRARKNNDTILGR